MEENCVIKLTFGQQNVYEQNVPVSAIDAVPYFASATSFEGRQRADYNFELDIFFAHCPDAETCKLFLEATLLRRDYKAELGYQFEKEALLIGILKYRNYLGINDWKDVFKTALYVDYGGDDKKDKMRTRRNTLAFCLSHYQVDETEFSELVKRLFHFDYNPPDLYRPNAEEINSFLKEYCDDYGTLYESASYDHKKLLSESFGTHGKNVH